MTALLVVLHAVFFAVGLIVCCTVPIWLAWLAIVAMWRGRVRSVGRHRPPQGKPSSGRSSAKPPNVVKSSDLTSRLQYIETESDSIRRRDGTNETEKRLAYLIGYLAGIARKHHETGER